MDKIINVITNIDNNLNIFSIPPSSPNKKHSKGSI